MNYAKTSGLVTLVALAVAVPRPGFADEQKAATAAQEHASEAEIKQQEIALKQKAIDARAMDALTELLTKNEDADALYDNAAGYAVFGAAKAGLILTGGGGNGVAVNKATNERVYMNMGTGGVGLGAGVQKFRLVMLFETDEALQKFVDGGWDSAVTAQAAAGKAGSNFASSFVNGVAIYQLTEKGLMAQADLTGTRFWVNDDLNE